MTKSLPTRPHIEALKKEAKRLQRSVASGDSVCLDLVRKHHPEYRSTASIPSIKLQEAQLVTAREYGFASWPDLVSHIESARKEQSPTKDYGDEKKLHIVNGEHVLGQLKEMGFRGRFLEWTEVLHEGRLHESLRGEAYNRIRAEAIAERYPPASEEQTLKTLAARDEALESCGDFEEVVLWFESDLYDQLQLLEILSRFDERRLRSTHMTLAFGAEELLGNLGSDEKEVLWEQRIPVSIDQVREAKQLWELICFGRFLEIQERVRERTFATPGLREALIRWFQEFPSLDNGLSRVERQILEGLVEGFARLGKLFLYSQSKESPVYMGDSTFYYYIQRLVEGDRPLIRQTVGEEFLILGNTGYSKEFRAQEFELSEEGRAVLEGRVDAITLRGIDRWIGGYHLTPQSRLRWDGLKGELVEP